MESSEKTVASGTPSEETLREAHSVPVLRHTWIWIGSEGTPVRLL